jgi:hypothetical protein
VRTAPSCTETRRTTSATILATGTRMLAMKTTSARYHEPSSHRKSTPLMIVSSDEPKSELVSIMGSVFAGT